MKISDIRKGKKICAWLTVLFMFIGGIEIVPINAEAATKKYVKKITLSDTELELEEGDKEQIKYKVYAYKGASKKIKLKVSNNKVVSAKVSGHKISVYAKSAGKSVITVISKGKNKRGKKIAKRIKVYVEAENDDDLDYDYDEDSEEKNTGEQEKSEQPTSEQVKSEQVTSEQPTSEQVKSERVTSEQPTSEQARSEQTNSEQATSGQTTSEQATNKQVTSELTTSEESTTEQETTEQAKQEEKNEKLPELTYQVNIENDGWVPSVKDGSISGKTASSKSIESFKLYLEDEDGNSALRYAAHIIGDGWQDWKTSGYVAGIQGQSKYIDSFRVTMLDQYTSLYDVYYRVYVQDYGWLSWAKNGEIAGSTGIEIPIEAIVVKIVEKGTDFDVQGSSYLQTPSLSYQSYVKGSGWQNTVDSDQTSGTTTAPIEAVKVTYTGFDGKNAISVNSHIFNSGWKGWKSSGEISGETGTSSYYDAVQIKLNDTMSKIYDVYYKVYVCDYGWLGWAKNGATAGSTEVGVPVTAFQVKVVEKNASFNTGESPTFSRVTMEYQANVESLGWQNVVMENGIAGTTGQSKKLTAISIGMNDFKNDPSITYNAHCSKVGWQGWKNSGIIAGGYGAEKPIEAIQIKLISHLTKYFSVYYRMHVANYGWLGWAKDGEPAGTIGGGVPAEAIQIVIVSKLKSFDRGGTAYHELPPAQTSNSANQVANRISELETTLCGKYFNINRNGACGSKCRGHACSNCLTSNIVQQTWLKNEFGNLSTNQFPTTPTSDVTLSRAGYSCAGFAAFAEWYLYRNSTSDTVNVKKIGTYTFNSANVSSYAQVGDLIRLEASGGGSGHSAIIVSWDSSGITVIDSNWSGTYNCLVQKHKIYYSAYGLITISRHQ